MTEVLKNNHHNPPGDNNLKYVVHSPSVTGLWFEVFNIHITVHFNISKVQFPVLCFCQPAGLINKLLHSDIVLTLKSGTEMQRTAMNTIRAIFHRCASFGFCWINVCKDFYLFLQVFVNFAQSKALFAHILCANFYAIHFYLFANSWAKPGKWGAVENHTSSGSAAK